jgi:UDP-N-acetylmuramate--alanine ligase
MATFNAKRIRKKEGCYSFTAYAYNKRLGRINLRVLGRHNIYNALSVIATASLLGVDFDIIKSGIESFVGVKRRNEEIGEIDGIRSVCDYAHHPREIEAQLKIVREQKGKSLVVFQPHTYSRTKSLMEEFVDVLSKFDNLIVYKTYPARENFDGQGSAKRLYHEIKKVKANVLYADNEQELYELIKESCTTNKLNKLLFLGAGDIYDIARKMVTSSNYRNKLARKEG